jgi:hypothetical protein
MMKVLILVLMPFLLVGCKKCFCSKEGRPKFEKLSDVECFVGGETRTFKDVEEFSIGDSGTRILLKEEIGGRNTRLVFASSVHCFAKTYNHQVNATP